ncbi:uncharacterized protein BDR25DRAFT_122047 [Lindgomyces ingoldianus]|uniref:Uncharacterized protein n=1 Tax=Lindgomyces ingoldianus TaxID=673940 RepID=A0ACB6R7Z6_9PLEO|nr:uncharacterized protein BDR25DRAFT_122047 [Lindgomyces ingoldianus]KAF2474442.1 hypothetical protein BDR25DRAFT_122047 [Lindgomyces ingoldianus]
MQGSSRWRAIQKRGRRTGGKASFLISVVRMFSSICQNTEPLSPIDKRWCPFSDADQATLSATPQPLGLCCWGLCPITLRERRDNECFSRTPLIRSMRDPHYTFSLVGGSVWVRLRRDQLQLLEVSIYIHTPRVMARRINIC